MKRTLFFLLFTVLAVSVCAQEIEGPAEVPAGKPVWFSVTGSSENVTIGFLPNPVLDTSPAHIIPGHALFWVAKSGSYTLTAIVVNWQSHTWTPLVKEVVVTEGPTPPVPPTPPTPPNPPVPPTPPPPPVPKTWQIMFFHQSDRLDNTPDPQLEMLVGLAFRHELVAKGHNFRGSYDIDALAALDKACQGNRCPTGAKLPAELAPWFEAVKGASMPRVAVAPADGGDIRSFPLPSSAPEFYKLLEGLK